MKNVLDIRCGEAVLSADTCPTVSHGISESSRRRWPWPALDPDRRQFVKATAESFEPDPSWDCIASMRFFTTPPIRSASCAICESARAERPYHHRRPCCARVRVVVPHPTPTPQNHLHSLARRLGQDYVVRFHDATTTTLAHLSRVGDIETVPVAKAEPISLNVALDVRRFLTHNGIKSLAVVAQALRCERSMLIYRAVLEPAGVTTHCQPAWGTRTPVNWMRTWHGVQDVALQFLKLQYYRFYVMPWRAGRIGRA